MREETQSKYLKLLEFSLFGKIRLYLAGIICPELTKDYYKYYFTHEYLISVHKFYESEIRSLNRTILKLNKKNSYLKTLINLSS